MPDYTIRATVEVAVQITVSVESVADARAILEDHLIMTAGLVDMPDGAEWSVDEDSIAGIQSVRIDRA